MIFCSFMSLPLKINHKINYIVCSDLKTDIDFLSLLKREKATEPT